MENIWITIFSSAGVASVISAIASFVNNRLAHNREYKDDYYKMVIAKRMDAYSKVEVIILSLKKLVRDESDDCLYNVIFNNSQEEFFAFQTQLYEIAANSVWFSKDMYNALSELNLLFTQIDSQVLDDGSNLLILGKQNRKKIADIRIRLEDIFRRDILSLHKIEEFLKNKNR